MKTRKSTPSAAVHGSVSSRIKNSLTIAAVDDGEAEKYLHAYLEGRVKRLIDGYLEEKNADLMFEACGALRRVVLSGRHGEALEDTFFEFGRGNLPSLTADEQKTADIVEALLTQRRANGSASEEAAPVALPAPDADGVCPWDAPDYFDQMVVHNFICAHGEAIRKAALASEDAAEFKDAMGAMATYNQGDQLLEADDLETAAAVDAFLARRSAMATLREWASDGVIPSDLAGMVIAGLEAQPTAA